MQLPVYDDDILLYTMEKCGTTTVLNTVKSAGIEVNRATRLTIDSFDHYYKKIITIVRDPMDWAISYYLEMPGAHPDDLIEPDTFGTVRNFHMNVDPLYPSRWFIDHFREIIGVNVYAKWFRKRLKYEIYSLNRVLVLVTHHLTETLIPALSEFTGRPQEDFTLHPQSRTNGSDRFGPIYYELHRKIKYRRLWFIDNIVESQYCKQFFSLDERKRMIEKWTI
jgi:hypothetical protein